MSKTIIGASLLIMMTIMFAQCKTMKLEDNIKLMENSSHFYVGSGGGFSGQMVDYHFLENGHIIKTNSLKKETIQLDKKLDKNQFTQIKNQISSRLTKDIGLPANMSSYIVLTANGQSTKAIWEKGSIGDPELQSIYRLLMNIIKEEE